jgi:hypothetical protein
MIGGDAYWFILANNTAVSGSSTLMLLRVKGGATALLNSVPGPSLPGALSTPYVLSMTISTGGGSTPNIVCAAGGVNVMQQFDIDASAIEVPGRWGFGMCRDRQEAGPIKSVTLAQYFQIDDTLTSTTVHRDEWTRAHYFGSSISGDGNQTFTGATNLMCMYLGDVHSSTVQANAWIRDPGNNRIRWDTGNNGSLVTYDRPATSQYSQHRSVIARWTGSLSTHVPAFLYLRGTAVNGNTAACYAMVLDVTAGPTFTLTLGTTLKNIVPYTTPIATAVIGGLAFDQDILLEMQVVNVGPGSPATGTPTITCKINGVVPTWTSAGLLGYTMDGMGNWLDGSGSPTLSGQEEGFGAVRVSNTLMTVIQDSWTDLPVTVPQPEIRFTQGLLEYLYVPLGGIHPAPVPEMRWSQGMIEYLYHPATEMRWTQGLVEYLYVPQVTGPPVIGCQTGLVSSTGPDRGLVSGISVRGMVSSCGPEAAVVSCFRVRGGVVSSTGAEQGQLACP